MATNAKPAVSIIEKSSRRRGEALCGGSLRGLRRETPLSTLECFGINCHVHDKGSFVPNAAAEDGGNVDRQEMLARFKAIETHTMPSTALRH